MLHSATSKSSAVVEMAAHCCTTRMVKRWDASVWGKIKEKRASAVMDDIMPKN